MITSFCNIIKSMKKLLIFLILLMLCPSAFGEGYPPQGGREEYPIYWYLFRHADRLKKVLDTKKFFRLHGWFCEYLVKITRDGDVIPLEVTISQNKIYDKQIKKIIAETKSEPFGDEIKEDYLIVEIGLSYADWGEYADVWYGPNDKLGRYVYCIMAKSTR